MTETDPEKPEHEIADAGTVGARRQEVGEPVAPDEEMSLNLPPKVPDGTPSSDLGVSPSERDGTPRLADRANTGGVAERAKAAGVADRTAGAGETGGVDRVDRHDSGTSKESVRQDIENDRRELGDTVEALMHKTDVKGRVQETATQVGEELRRVGSKTATTATEMVGRVKDAAPEVVGRVKEVTPVEVKDAAEKVTAQVGKRPVAAVAAVAVLALVVLRLLRRGNKKK